MKSSAGLALAACVLPAAPGYVQAADNVTHTVLSAEDVGLYRAIFRAEHAGESAKAGATIAKLSDTSLVGYVLKDRYLGPHHFSKYSELKSWLETYGDLAEADRIYRLARRRAPKGAHVPEPVRVRWRGAQDAGEAFVDLTPESDLARRTLARMRSLARSGKADAAAALLKNVSARPALSLSDAEKLGTYVAAIYLAEAKDASALALAEDVAARNGETADQCHWTAGLAAYRMGQFETAASHFETVAHMSGTSGPMSTAGAFWAARSWMQTGQPERVIPLYQHAASQPGSFYGLIATRFMGKDEGSDFVEPELDTESFAALMQDAPARRAVALWQIGRRGEVEAELARALGEIEPHFDAAFAVLARHLEAPQIELRAAELASAPYFRLSGLYPVPPFQPKDGYTIDQAVVLAFAKQERRFAADAVSRSGARGLMQLMPRTAALVAHDTSLAGKNKAPLDDPSYSMKLGQDYLNGILERQGGILFALAAAYNAGEGSLARWMTAYEGLDDPLIFIESIPASETREYVKRVNMNLWMYRQRLGEPMDGIDEAASGAWPVYKRLETVAAN